MNVNYKGKNPSFVGGKSKGFGKGKRPYGGKSYGSPMARKAIEKERPMERRAMCLMAPSMDAKAFGWKRCQKATTTTMEEHP